MPEPPWNELRKKQTNKQTNKQTVKYYVNEHISFNKAFDITRSQHVHTFTHHTYLPKRVQHWLRCRQTQCTSRSHTPGGLRRRRPPVWTSEVFWSWWRSPKTWMAWKNQSLLPEPEWWSTELLLYLLSMKEEETTISGGEWKGKWRIICMDESRTVKLILLPLNTSFLKPAV